MPKLKKEILKVLKYFSQFSYSPSLEEIHTFLQARGSISSLKMELEKMMKDRVVVKKTLKMSKYANLASKPGSNQPTRFNLRGWTGRLKSYYNSLDRYTLGEYGMRIKNEELRMKNSFKKLKKVQPYLRLISRLPQVRLVGLSGSMSMFSTDKDDDIDLFIITARNRIWTARFLTKMITHLRGDARRRGEEQARDKVCLNMFFDENALKVPRFKQNEYVAHEVLQMKPMVVKGDIFKRYLDANKWVFDIFPNASAKFKAQSSKLQFKAKSFTLYTVVLRFTLYTLSFIGDFIEYILRVFQLLLINRHRTTELISDRQLWFFPDDFEKKLKT